MAISLSKGGNVSLSKENPNLGNVAVGLGWDVRATDGADYDLDASVFLLNEGSRVRSDSDFIFYNNLRSTDGSVEHTGDNRTGKGEGDDEQVKVDLQRVPEYVQKLVFSVTIHEADSRSQNFGQVEGAFIRVVNGETRTERSCATTSRRTPPRRRLCSSARSTATGASGSSAPSDRASPGDWGRWPATTVSA